MTRRPFLLLPGALAVALLAAACGSSYNSGPAGSSGNGSGQQCIPARAGQPRSMGDFVIYNSSKTEPVTVQQVQITHVHGLAMGKPWLVPITTSHGTRTLIGAWSYPPYGKAWDQRVPAIGASVAPRQNLNLVVPVWRTRSPSGWANVRVRYAAGGHEYAYTYGLQVMVSAHC
jgi:hypothetical protein